MKKRIFLSAGEPSGDFLGAQLMKALKTLYPDQMTFHGVGGPQMAAEGLTSLFPISDLAVMGLVEVLPHILTIRRRINQTIQAIAEVDPAAIITIDAPGFNFRIGKAIKKRGIQAPLIHYVAPSVWAWRPGRAQKVSQFLDHLLTLFPFEPPYFEAHGLSTTFVGHPVAELDFTSTIPFRQQYGIGSDTPIVCLLPGSRHREISSLLPIFTEVIHRLSDVRVVVPTLDHLVKELKEALPPSAILTTSLEEKYAAFNESTVALAANGTVALELAAAGLPMIMNYKMNALTYAIVKQLVHVEHACLVNILLKSSIVPEFIQAKCTSDALYATLSHFLEYASIREEQIIQLKKVMDLLKAPLPFTAPSLCAAHVIGCYTH